MERRAEEVELVSVKTDPSTGEYPNTGLEQEPEGDVAACTSDSTIVPESRSRWDVYASGSYGYVGYKNLVDGQALPALRWSEHEGLGSADDALSTTRWDVRAGDGYGYVGHKYLRDGESKPALSWRKH
jgi:hypothetical protein